MKRYNKLPEAYQTLRVQPDVPASNFPIQLVYERDTKFVIADSPEVIEANEPFRVTAIRVCKCDCELRNRKWNGYGKCLFCSGRYTNE